MNFNLVTIFPEITKLFDFGVIGKAIEKDLISMNSLNRGISQKIPIKMWMMHLMAEAREWL